MNDELVQIIAALELAEKTILQAQAELAERDARIEALTAEVRRLDYSGIHTCHAECPRLPCAQRREIEALTVRAEAAEARNKVLEDRLRHIANYYPAGHRITELALEALGGEHA